MTWFDLFSALVRSRMSSWPQLYRPIRNRHCAVIVLLALLAAGCGSDPAEELQRVHVSACADSDYAGITVIDPGGNLRRIRWAAVEWGPNCEHWNFSTWWKIRVRRAHDGTGGYHLDAMEPTK